MARLAATEHGADWVVNSDVDEFWWPRGGTFPTCSRSIPRRYGVVQSFVRHFVPVPDDGGRSEERMTLRLTAQAPINDPRSPWRPFRKVVHRGDPRAEIVEGSHSVGGTTLTTLRGWYPLEVLHFPIRTRGAARAEGARVGKRRRQVLRLGGGGGRAGSRVPRARAPRRRAGRVRRRVRRRSRSTTTRPGPRWHGGCVDRGHARARRAAGARACRDGRPRFPRTTPVDDAAFAADAAVLGEADVVRVRRRLDELEQRVAMLEARPGARVERRLRRLVRAGAPRDREGRPHPPRARRGGHRRRVRTATTSRAGVDHVIATDHRSDDGTTDILESYERDGTLTLLREDGETLEQAAWVTRMARLAATEHGADWVINCDADEFWWPRVGTARTSCSARCRRGSAWSAGCGGTSCPRPGGGDPFERMIVRRRPSADLADPSTRR